MAERNIWVDGTWYGPDYPENGTPPADKVDGEFLGRKTQGVDEDVEPVGWAAVKTAEQAAQFGQPVPVENADESRADAPEVDPVGIKAVDTTEEAATFRGQPATAVGEQTPATDDTDESSTAKTGTTRTRRTASK